jgi:hypothetical protein
LRFKKSQPFRELRRPEQYPVVRISSRVLSWDTHWWVPSICWNDVHARVEAKWARFTGLSLENFVGYGGNFPRAFALAHSSGPVATDRYSANSYRTVRVLSNQRISLGKPLKPLIFSEYQSFVFLIRWTNSQMTLLCVQLGPWSRSKVLGSVGGWRASHLK